MGTGTPGAGESTREEVAPVREQRGKLGQRTDLELSDPPPHPVALLCILLAPLCGDSVSTENRFSMFHAVWNMRPVLYEGSQR